MLNAGYSFGLRQQAALATATLPHMLANAMGTSATNGTSTANMAAIAQSWGAAIVGAPATTLTEGTGQAVQLTPNGLVKHVYNAEPGALGVGHYTPVKQGLLSGKAMKASVVAARITFLMHDPENVISTMQLVPLSSINGPSFPSANVSQSYVLESPQRPMTNQLITIVENYTYWTGN